MSASIAPVRSRTASAQSLSSWVRTRLDTLPTWAAVAIFVVMVVYGEVAYGRIVQMNTVTNLLINNAPLIIIAVGMTFVIITGGIDLSVGAVIALTSVSGVMLINAGWNDWVVVALMILMGSTFGLMSGCWCSTFRCNRSLPR